MKRPPGLSKPSAPDDFVTLAVPVPRSVLTMTASPPDLLSQRNVEGAVGIPPRSFLALLRSAAFPLAVARVGKLRLVERAAFIAWLRRRNQELKETPPQNDTDELAAELGLRRVGGRR